ncbi:MAG: hypothetical protein GY950_35715 [bacterium]|nr:hypothetical protein [bacterium]
MHKRHKTHGAGPLKHGAGTLYFLCFLCLFAANLFITAAPTETGKKERTFKKKIISRPPTKYKGEPGDFIFRDAELQNVVLFFAKQYKINVVLDPGIQGKVTCRMIQVPWDQALDVILRQHGLAMIKEGAIIRAASLIKKNEKTSR